MKFFDIINQWANRYFSQPDAIYLVAVLVIAMALLMAFGGALAPVLTGLVIAFLLQGIVGSLEHRRVPRWAAVYLAFLLFLGTVLALSLLVLPLLWRQLQSLVQVLPSLAQRLQEGVSNLAQRFPEYITSEQISALLEQVSREAANVGGAVIETAFTQVFSLLGLVLYLVLVPITVFFLLKDKDRLINAVREVLPTQRPMINAVAAEMNVQLGNYVRGKALEILIVGVVTFLAFLILDLNYAALLSVVVGFSVLIPFVGAAVVTLPVFAVAVLQFGWSADLAIVMAVYGILQFLDGNVLVPLLFSEANDLHPVAIIIAILAFGSIWGIWGVFFAIPLATLIKAIFNSWPRSLAVASTQQCRTVHGYPMASMCHPFTVTTLPMASAQKCRGVYRFNNSNLRSLSLEIKIG